MDMAALLCADAWAADLASKLRPSAHSLEETSGRCHVTPRGLAPAQSLSDSPEFDCGETPQFASTQQIIDRGLHNAAMAGGLGCRPFLALHELAKRQHEVRSGAEVSSLAGLAKVLLLLISNSPHLL